MSGVTARGARQPGSGRGRPRLWVGVFVVLGLLAAALLSAEVWFNLRQQLRLERLAEARRLWEANGPKNYLLGYVVNREGDPDPGRSRPEKYTVRVRDGRAVSWEGADGRPLDDREAADAFGSMDELFDAVAERLRADAETGGRRPFVTAAFDRHDGHIVHYIHSDAKTRERLEVTVHLRPE
jgi:hypothetical protein